MSEVPVTRNAWRPLSRPGCVGVEVSGVLREPGLALALLRFVSEATIDEHAAQYDIDVRCLAGHGWVSIGEHRFPVAPDDQVRWPAGVMHRLWTDDEPMTTLMMEHPPTAVHQPPEG
jgi:quercetin dioxygenase-like cupin family protein